MHLSISSFEKVIKICIIFMGTIAILLIVLISVFHRTWRPKDNLYYFYQLDKNSLDVINIGSSHIYSSINTLQLYQQKGIASYNLSAGSQSVWYSYYYLREALKTQSPKVIMLDVYTLRNSDDSLFAESAQLNLLSMKPSWNKWQAIMASDTNDRINIFLGFPKNHMRYSKLTVDDYENNPCLNMMGYVYSENVEPLEQSMILDVRDIKDISPITEKSELYLRKIIELCQQRNIEVILVNAPWPNITEKDEEKYNYIGQIADEYGIDFINGCAMIEQLGIDYSIDNSDSGGHLNYNGSQKWTSFLENYLSEKYELPDHRQEHPRIWEESVRVLKNIKAQNKLSEINNIVEYFDYLMNNSDYSFAVFVKKNGDLPDDINKCFEQMGIQITKSENGFILRIPNGQIYSGVDFLSDTEMYEDMYKKICIFGKNDEEYHFMKMQFNSQIAEERTGEDICFIVFNPFTNSALDIAVFKKDDQYNRFVK